MALVTENGLPVAVVCIRQKGKLAWEPVTQWILPGLLFPMKSGYEMAILEALQKELWVGWWRMPNPPQKSLLVRYFETLPTYRMRVNADVEQYWRENGYFKTIRRIRNKCSSFSVSINEPGSAEWIIKNWEVRWRKNENLPDPSLPDRIVAAKYLEDHNYHFSLILRDGDKKIGGATMTVHNKDLVAGVLYRDLQYHRLGIGDRLIDLSFSFAQENGFETFDIGGGHKYKKHWAPQTGDRHYFQICPEPLYLLKQTIQKIRALSKKENVAKNENVHEM